MKHAQEPAQAASPHSPGEHNKILMPSRGRGVGGGGGVRERSEDRHKKQGAAEQVIKNGTTEDEIVILGRRDG